MRFWMCCGGATSASLPWAAGRRDPGFGARGPRRTVQSGEWRARGPGRRHRIHQPGVAAEALPRIVRGVMRGEAAIPRTLAMALIERHRILARSEVGMRPTKSPLSSGEREVLDLMATGATSREIATELVLPLETIQSREQHILDKLGIHSRAAAIVIARELRHRHPG